MTLIMLLALKSAFLSKVLQVSQINKHQKLMWKYYKMLASRWDLSFDDE